MTKKFSFTVGEILDAAEKSNYKNTNDLFVGYNPPRGYYGRAPIEIGEVKEVTSKTYKPRIVAACVIGEAFLNLGFTENGIAALDLSRALERVYPDENPMYISITDKWGTTEIPYYNLSDFINELNGMVGYGKKRITKLARKYFSESLEQVITLEG